MQAKAKVKSQMIDWLKFGVLLFVIYLVISNSIGLTKVFGHSMDPTLKDGSWILVNRLSSHFREPEYGDVAIIHQEDKGYDIIKRVIGLPGDTVAIEDGTVFVNRQPLPEIYTLGESSDIEEVKVKEDHIFIMGDNRSPGESLDSRDPNVGPVPITDVTGYAVISLFPMYSIMRPLEL